MISLILNARSVAFTNSTTDSRFSRSGSSGYDFGETRSLVVRVVVLGGVGVIGWPYRRHSVVVVDCIAVVTRVGWGVVSTGVFASVENVLVSSVDSDGDKLPVQPATNETEPVSTGKRVRRETRVAGGTPLANLYLGKYFLWRDSSDTGQSNGRLRLVLADFHQLLADVLPFE